MTERRTPGELNEGRAAMALTLGVCTGVVGRIAHAFTAAGDHDQAEGARAAQAVLIDVTHRLARAQWGGDGDGLDALRDIVVELAGGAGRRPAALTVLEEDEGGDGRSWVSGDPLPGSDNVA